MRARFRQFARLGGDPSRSPCIPRYSASSRRCTAAPPASIPSRSSAIAAAETTARRSAPANPASHRRTPATIAICAARRRHRCRLPLHLLELDPAPAVAPTDRGNRLPGAGIMTSAQTPPEVLRFSPDAARFARLIDPSSRYWSLPCPEFMAPGHARRQPDGIPASAGTRNRRQSFFSCHARH